MQQPIHLLLIFLLFFSVAFGQDSRDYSVPLTADIDRSIPAINVRWNQDLEANNFSVYKKLASAKNWSWQANIQPTGDTVFHDDEIELHQSYEYKIIKNMGGYTANGYILASIDGYSPIHNGGILLVLDTTVTNLLKNEVNELTWDLRGDGYQVYNIQTGRNAEVSLVKQAIESMVQEKGNIEYLYLLGNVPVPYSGEIAPDGHVNNHLGAWPADVFYGVISNQWTDFSVNNTSAGGTRNDNVPGDGKYDQSIIPEDVTLGIGRVDLSNLSNFSQPEEDLLRQYLQKAHNFKHGQIILPKRGLIDDNFHGFNGEAFAANGWRNFSALLGNDQIREADYRTTMDTAGYLWSYGCGGGTYQSAAGIVNSAQLSQDSLLTAFTMLFGSYFGDWDNADNFLRTPLAQGLTLTNCWAGRPHWHFHHMGHGYPIGYSTRLTQNNTNNYFSNYGARFIHVALMGDPSLRMDYPEPVTDVNSQKVNNNVLLSWTYASSAEGYALFKSLNRNGPYVQIGTSATMSYTDSCQSDTGWAYYMVRPFRLDSSNNGTFYNYGIGRFDSAYIEKIDSYYFDPAFVIINGDSTTLVYSETNASNVTWIFEDTVKIKGDSFYYTFSGYPNDTTVEVLAIVSNSCGTDTMHYDVTINISYVGMKETSPTKIKIYPNPAMDILSLDQSNMDHYGHIEIVGSDGRVWRKLPPASVDTRQLPIGDLSAGTYYVRYFRDKGFHYVLPFVKQ